MGLNGCKKTGSGIHGAGVSQTLENAMSPTKYVLVGCKRWNRRVFVEVVSRYAGEWYFIGAREELSSAFIRAINPRYIFFLHWSWKVPADIVDNFECVCFHETDVPYGRGGSPLQNLIVRGHRETKITALRMTAEFDAGPVYLKKPLGLEGNAEEIYLRAMELSASMIQEIIRDEIQPVAQQGEVVNFKRRNPEESRIAVPESLKDLYDFIRMLDAEGYPQAFLDYAGFRFEFSRAALYDGRIAADVRITRPAGTTDTNGGQE
jgi:methionyl-tRNA formyltransferase